jgi:signal transduction histidine kinase
VILVAAVPAAQLLTTAHRALASGYWGTPIRPWYRPASGGPIGWLQVWIRDQARWRDLAFLLYTGTGGLVVAVIPIALLGALPVYVVLPLVFGGWFFVMWTVIPLVALLWWVLTPPLTRARFFADRAILAESRTAELERHVEHVSTTRAEAIDHSAAELRRIERDLHDGAQARIVSVGMNIGLAEQLLRTDVDAAAALLADARMTTSAALDGLRGVVRGIHPPVLADRGLVGAIQALAVQLPIPVQVDSQLSGRPPGPVESAAYFAVTECLANVVKHAHATAATVRLRFADGVLRLTVSDNGLGGAAVEKGTGLAGLVRRLAAFDGTTSVTSPAGGPTEVSMEVPCALS